jgi:LacI family transcriptional regulator
LVTRKTNSIGFILPDILNPVHAAIAKAFGDALHDAELSLFIANSDESAELEATHLGVLIGKEVDGIALTPTGRNRSMLHGLVESGKPLVLLDRRLDGIDADCVLFDNLTGAYQATRHLIELGHSRIGLINLASSLTPGHERLAGYERALLEGGLSLDPALVVEGEFKAQRGNVLAASVLQVQPPPTALLVSSNRLMYGVLSLVKERGIRVPLDLALAAFDDVGYYAIATPSITAVATSVADFGSKAARLLIERVTGAYSGEPRVVRVPCELKVRESTLGVLLGSSPAADSEGGGEYNKIAPKLSSSTDSSVLEDRIA